MSCKIEPNWIDLELEHTTSRRKARAIVKDHLREFGCGYYPALKKMESKLKK